MEIKQLIPSKVKFALWWLFKSPQRKLGWFTLKNDLLGLAFYGFAKVFPFYKPQKISVCVALYNRNEHFLNHLLGSLSSCKLQEFIELSVFDCGSDDVQMLEKKSKEQFKGNVIFQSEARPFSRSFAINKAAKQATGELVFICDSDFSLPKNLVELCCLYTRFGSFWFPIVFYLYKNKPTFYHPKNGEWMIWGGKGLLCCKRSAFLELGGLDESFVSWGGEDEAFWLKCHQNGKIILRNKEHGLLHHYHKSLNPKYLKIEVLTDTGVL